MGVMRMGRGRATKDSLSIGGLPGVRQVAPPREPWGHKGCLGSLVNLARP